MPPCHHATMANAGVFSRTATAVRNVPIADAHNDAGGLAYTADPKYALALYACTGTFRGTYYASAHDHLDRIQGLLAQVTDLEFVAKVAVYAREQGHMKDTPAFLLAHLMAKDTEGTLFARAFPRIIDSGKMACTFWQIVRSGVAGRKNFGTRPKRIFARWFDALSDDQLFRASIGAANPSLADVMSVVRPKPVTDSRKALHGYMLGAGKKHAYHPEHLPTLIQQVEAFKAHPETAPLPNVPFRLLDSMPLKSRDWAEIALRASWQTLRQSLNTYARHGVFKDSDLVHVLAGKLRDEVAIKKAHAFPYQILVAYMNAADNIPRELVDALHDAMELATDNVPVIEGDVVICPDVSQSMHAPITGDPNGTQHVSKVRCVDVAALFTACLLRKNPSARVLPFAEDVRAIRLEPRDSIMTNAQKLASMPGGSTNCSAPLARLNAERAQVDGVVFVSDYESWQVAPTQRGTIYSGRSPMAVEWAILATFNANRGPKLICMDLTPRVNLQTPPDPDTLCVGGFSDEVFNVAKLFLAGDLGHDRWLQRIQEVEL